MKLMKRRDLLENRALSSLKISLGFLEGEFFLPDPDWAAARKLYLELLTRISSQYLPPKDDDEKMAPESVYTDLPFDAREPTSPRLGVWGVCQASYPGAQSDFPLVQRQMTPALIRQGLPGRCPLRRIPRRTGRVAKGLAQLHQGLRRNSGGGGFYGARAELTLACKYKGE